MIKCPESTYDHQNFSWGESWGGQGRGHGGNCPLTLSSGAAHVKMILILSKQVSTDPSPRNLISNGVRFQMTDPQEVKVRHKIIKRHPGRQTNLSNCTKLVLQPIQKENSY